MRCWTISICSFLVTVQIAFGQPAEVETPFNEQKEHRVGFGIAITGFRSNVAYFISPHYTFRYHRHSFSFTPFYGNLDGVKRQKDIGIGVDYRLYPFKNQNDILLYFPIGIHYNHKWSKTNERSALLYKIGFGVETLLGKRFGLSLDANFGIGQLLGASRISNETGTFGPTNQLNYYFLPVIRLSYRL